MKTVEIQTPLMDKVKDWAGGMFQRVGSSFKGRGAQSVLQIPNLSLAASLQNGSRSAPEAVTCSVESTYFHRLRKYCSSAFGGPENDGNRESDDITETDDVHYHYRREYDGRNSVERNDYSIRCSRSTISLGAELHSCVGKPTIRKGESMTSEIVLQIETASGNTASCLKSLKQHSNDSGVDIDFTELSEKQHKCTSVLSTHSNRENDEVSHRLHRRIRADKERDLSERMERQENIEEETDTDEKYSKNYSEFCEKVSNVQKRNNKYLSFRCREHFRPFICSLRAGSTKKNGESFQQTEKCKLTISGSITLGLQHFIRSRQLRVVLISVESSVEHNSKMFCKVTLTRNSSTQKEKTRQLRSNMGNGEFNDTFNMALETDDLNGYVLTVQLRRVSTFFRRRSMVGVADIALENIDLTLDTTMSVKLRDAKSPRQVLSEDDLEILSENRSIQAEVEALLQESETSFPRLRRHQSLPGSKCYGLLTDRTKRAMTLDRVRTKVNRQES